MKGGGLGRMQQRFNAAVVAVLALAGLRNMAGGQDHAAAASKGYGHPIHAKYLRSLFNKMPTMRYPGYCAGAQETARRQTRGDFYIQLRNTYRGIGL
jgi:hypothetical protein